MYINEIMCVYGCGCFVLLYEIVFLIGLFVLMVFGVWFVLCFGWEIMYFVGGLLLILLFVFMYFVLELLCWFVLCGWFVEVGCVVGVFEGLVCGELLFVM